MSDNQQQQRRMWLRSPEEKARVYQVVPGSRIWWADAKTPDGKYICDIVYSRDEAFRKAHELANRTQQ